DYYGSEVPLQQVASIAVEEGRTLVISPWEKSVVQAIEKAIFKSDLGLTPMTAGTVIRIPMPPLTAQRRREITKVLRHDAENAPATGAGRACALCRVRAGCEAGLRPCACASRSARGATSRRSRSSPSRARTGDGPRTRWGA